MAVKARGEITLTSIVDIASTTRYYKLQSSTLAKPAKPTVNPPSGWVTTEPAYTAGATNSLYTCDLTVFSDDTWSYSDVSLSSSYDAAKDAYNKAVAAAKTATDYMDFGADGLVIGDMTSGTLAGNVRIASDGVEIRNGSSVLARLKAGILELAANSVNAIIKLCGGKGTIAYYAETNQLAIMSPGSIAMTACQTLPDGTVQPYDAGIACNQYGVLAKGAVEVSGSLTKNSETVYAAKTLYNNASGSNGTIALSESVANFAMIEIYYKSNDGENCSVKVADPNGKVVNMAVTHPEGSSNGAVYWKSRNVVVSGASIASDGTRYTQLGMWNGNNVIGSLVNYVYITKVIGYR